VDSMYEWSVKISPFISTIGYLKMLLSNSYRLRSRCSS